MKKLFGVFTLLLFAHLLFAQPPVTEAQARAELDRMGLEEDEVRKRLLTRGINIDNIDPNNPSQLLEVESALQEVIAEIEAEKAGGNVTAPPPAPPANPNPQPVKEQVIVDSTDAALEEIIDSDQEQELAEELIEKYQETLPPSIIYGQDIFRDKSIKIYRQAEDIKPPDSYVLGVGDIIAVSIWGVSQEGGVYEINKSGFIKPAQMPRIYLKGIPLGKAKDLLRNRFSNFYRFQPEEFEVAVNYSRTITVNIVGEVINYGSYTFPAINTAFNALVAAGGPSDIGSVRNIQLIRAGAQPKRIDVYEYLLNPAVENKYYLQENDYIHIPIAERLVSISGAVKKPFKFELTKGEELKKLIEFAGGFSVNAYKGNLQVKRIINDTEMIIDVDYRDLENGNNDFLLLDGDEITVKAIAKPYQNYIEISGAVEFEGRFELTDGMRLTDLLNKAILMEEAKRDFAFIQRANVDGTVRYEKVDLAVALSNTDNTANIALQPRDRLIVYTQQDFVDAADFSVTGSVRKPFKLPYSVGKEIKINDAILLAGGLMPSATTFGYIIRRDPNNMKDIEVIRVDIQGALNNPASPANLVIQPFDELKIFSIDDLTDDAIINVKGAVRNPFQIAFAKNLTLTNAIAIAGGLKPNATTFGYVSRIDPTNSKKKSILRVDIALAFDNPDSEANIVFQPNDELVVYSTETFIDEANISVTGAVRSAGSFPFAENFTLKDILTMAGGLKIEAARSRIEVFRKIYTPDKPVETIVATLEVNEDLNVISGGEQFDLAPFDLVVVRTVPEFEIENVVEIMGEVKYPGPYPLMNTNERLMSIIDRSGGLTDKAFPGGATLFRSKDGVGYIVVELDRVLKNKNARSNFILKAGDVIEIPQKKDLVSIEGATKANELYPEKILGGGKINVAYHKGKNAKWYVDHYAAGVGEEGQRKRISVIHPNGEIEKTKNFLLFKAYPKVRKGSIVSVGAKPPKPEKEKEESDKEKVDWGRSLADGIAQATAVLSLILLVQQVNK